MSADDPSDRGETRPARDRHRSSMEVRAARITITTGPDAGRDVRVDSPTFVIGTGAAANLRLSDDLVSREHVRLTLSAAGVRVRDADSTNGTWLGETRISDALVTSAVTLVLGDTTLTLRVDGAPVHLPLSPRSTFGSAIGESEVMRHLFAILERAAETEATVLLEGESGVGKEVLAQAIHTVSPRAAGPFVALDCGAIPANLVESELFGHERGAFTGADTSRRGAFEQANGGTIFLDELGELPVDMQPKLLRVIETREIKPVGGTKARPIDVRIVAATNKNLAEASARNEFRRDLFYRLAVVRVVVPPLRERREDVLPLARAFLRRGEGREHFDVPDDIAAMLTSHAWPGNVRELRNVMDRYAVLGGDPEVLFDRMPPRPGARGGETVPAADLSHLPFHEARRIALDRFERAYLPAVLARHGNVVVRAADAAGLGRTSFHRIMQRIRAGHGPGDEADD